MPVSYVVITALQTCLFFGLVLLLLWWHVRPTPAPKRPDPLTADEYRAAIRDNLRVLADETDLPGDLLNLDQPLDYIEPRPPARAPEGDQSFATAYDYENDSRYTEPDPVEETQRVPIVPPGYLDQLRKEQ